GAATAAAPPDIVMRRNPTAAATAARAELRVAMAAPGPARLPTATTSRFEGTRSPTRSHRGRRVARAFGHTLTYEWQGNAVQLFSGPAGGVLQVRFAGGGAGR